MSNPPDIQRALEYGLRQASLPDTGRDMPGLARQRASEPLKPRKPQQACDQGLFSDDRAQSDLIDQARRKS